MAKDNAPPQIGGVYNLPVPPEKKATDFLNAYTGWVYSAVSYISKELSKIDLHLYKKKYKKNGQVEIDEIYEHDALSLLYSVNDFQTKDTFLEIHQTYIELTGESVWAILRDTNGNPTELWTLRPDWVSVLPSKQDYIEGYEYRPYGLGSGGQSIRFKRNDIIFFKEPNPVNPYRGKGRVQAGAYQIDIDTFSDDWNRTFFYNSALPYLVFTSEKNISPEAIKRFMEQWRSKFEGRFNSHKVAFLGGGFKPEKIGGNMKDLDFMEGKRYIRDEILALFHLSKANIGIVEDVNRANQEASDARFAKTVLKPRMTSLVSYLNEFYLRNWADEDLFFDYDDPTPEDVEFKLKVYENGLKNGWMTINEVREEENLPPVEGGDAIYLPFGLQPVGNVTPQPKSLINQLFSKGDKDGGVIKLELIRKSDKKERKLTIKLPPKKLWKVRQDNLKRTIKNDIFKLVYSLVKMKDEQNARANKEEFKEAFWKNMVAKTNAEEEAMKKLLYNLFTEQESNVNNNIRDNFKKSAYKSVRMKALSDFLFDKEDEVKRFFAILAPFVRHIVEDKGRELLDFLGAGGNLQTNTDTAVRYLNTDGVRFIKEINDTTIDLLRETLSVGLANDESIKELQERVKEVYIDATTSRAEMIARTEVLKSTNFATVEAYRQSGVVKGKEWLTAVDERVCPFCAEMDGKILPVDGTFFKRGETLNVEGQSMSFDYEAVKYPPLHPNCRCTTIPILD